MEMIGDRVVVQLRNAAFLRADAAGEIAEVVDSQRYVGRQRLAHRLAIVPGLGLGDGLQVLFDPVGDAVQQQGAFRHAGLAPGVLGGVGGVQRLFDVRRVRPGHLAQDAAVHRGGVLEIAAVDRWDPLSADEVVIARLELGGGGATEFGLGHDGFLTCFSGVAYRRRWDRKLVLGARGRQTGRSWCAANLSQVCDSRDQWAAPVRPSR